MDYKNFILRVPTAFLLFLIFLVIVLQYEKYINILVYLIYLVILVEIIFSFKLKLFILLISLIYLFFSLVCFELYLNKYYVREQFIYTIFLVIVFDISSYLFGSFFGKSKILPLISPNKTYFGLISGFIISFIFGYMYNYYFNFFDKILVILFITFAIISAFVGDIFESFLKRKSGIKNSSKILLGHGGFFDRFDSLLMVVVWLFFYNLII